MKKQLPIGISDFKKILDGRYYYVDKTLLIKDISESGDVALIARPRRFGKTLNLSMRRYFYEKTDQSTEYLFQSLNIWKHEAFRTLQGQYPVIFLTFKGAVFSSFQDTYATLEALVAEEFNRHDYLLEGTVLKPFEKELFERIRQSKASRSEFVGSIERLTNFLYRYHNKRVVVLLDEYDVPVQSAFIHNFYDEIIDVIRPLLTGVFKDNAMLEKGVITGVLTLAKAGIFSGLNNLEVFNLTHYEMADKFGFTEEEVTKMLTYYSIMELTSIKQWYNGYKFGLTEGIFNPWSILQCIKNKGALKIYWANTSDNVLLSRLIVRSSASTKSELEALLLGHTIDKVIEETIVFPNVDKYPELTWSLLLFTGYATYVKYELHEGKMLCSLQLPNQEIKFLYRDIIRNLFLEMSEQPQLFMQALTEGKVEDFSQLLQDFVLKSMSVYDISSAEPERSYHLFVLGLLVMVSDTYEVSSNSESGFGRYDIMLAPKNPHKPGIILEFKKVRSSTEGALELAAQKALAQIIDKQYAYAFSENVSIVHAYGIAFEGKKVFVLAQTLQR